MDPNQFDRLTRAVSAVVSRRGALGALLAGVASGLLGAADAAKRGGGKRKGRGRAQDKKRGKTRKNRGHQARAEATRCCSTGNRAPGAGVEVCAPDGARGRVGEGDGDRGGGERCCAGACQTGEWTNQATFGRSGRDPDQFFTRGGVAVAPDGLTAWVAEWSGSRVSVWGVVCPA